MPTSSRPSGRRRRAVRGEIRFVIETALDIPELWAGVTPRERALQVFSHLRVWDTELRNGVLIYVLAADRDVEIVADRGAAARISPIEWESACRLIEEPFSGRPFQRRRGRRSRSRGQIVRAGISGPTGRPRRASESARAPVAECRQPESFMRCHTLDMKTQSALRTLIVTALGVALVSGCSLLGDGPKWGAKRDAEKAAKAVPSLPEPVPTHRFEIDATTDIVGVVQKTARHQGRHAHRHRASLQRRL